MDFLLTPRGRKFLFGCLYFSEGAPIGFIWLALPTRLRAAHLPVEQITWLTAILVLPWTFKFAWAPLIDALRGRRWTLRHWIVAAQIAMGLTLLPLAWLDATEHFSTMAVLLLVHAVAAATQDVAIDALCISVTDAAERGAYNGWMQAGMLLGRAAMGGGALVLMAYLGQAAVVLLLVGLTWGSACLVVMARSGTDQQPQGSLANRLQRTLRLVAHAGSHRSTWFGLAFGLLGGAAFKSLEVVYGPFLVDRGYAQAEIGWFSAGPMIISMILGSLAGGWGADRWGRRRFVAASLAYLSLVIIALAVSDLALVGQRGPHLLVLLAATAFGIGLFTAASYALFMDLTVPAVAATQFSAFMGATNGCESWSSHTIGLLIASAGYPLGMLVMCGVSLASLPLLLALRPRVSSAGTVG